MSRDSKPQGYKRCANALNVTRQLGVSSSYQVEQEQANWTPVFNSLNQCVGYKNQHGQYLDVKTLPVDDITGYPILPSLATVPSLLAEDGFHTSAKVKRGKIVQVNKVRTTERPTAKASANNVIAGARVESNDTSEHGALNITATVIHHRPWRKRTKVTVHTSEQITCTRSSRRFN